MIWLRHELWEHQDGLSYRLAGKAETDRLATAHPEGVIKHIFYAPNPAAAVAQYYALRHLGPYVPGPDVSQDGFTQSQLESQLADFPDDEILSGQAIVHPEPAALVPEPPSEEAPPVPVEPPSHEPAAGHANLAEPAAPEVEPDVPHDPRDLWPVATEEIVAPRWARRARPKPNIFLALVRIVLLLIILCAVALGLAIVTGTIDGPTLFAQVRDLSIVKGVLPSS